MRQNKHTTQIYSPVGAGYVLEAHGPAPSKGNKNSPDKRAAVIVALVLALGTLAGAIASTNRNRSLEQGTHLNPHLTPSILLKLPGGYGIGDVLY